MKRTFKQIIFSVTTAMLFFSSVPGQVFAGAEPYIGEINYVAFKYAPRKWAKCDGQLLPISQNSALFSLLGTQYGGDGRTTFGLPDMRGRVPLHQGAGPGLSLYQMGAKGGAERVTLSVANLAAHSHTATATSTSTVNSSNITATSELKGVNAAGFVSSIANRSLAQNTNNYSTDAPNVNLHADSIKTTITGNFTVNTATSTTASIANTGNGQAFSIMQPYTVLNCIIALEGAYPPRS